MILSLLYLAVLFVLTILSIIAIGIFSSRHFVHKKLPGGVYFISFFAIFLLRIVVNMYLAFVHQIIFTKINILFDLIPLVMLLFVFHKLHSSLDFTLLRVANILLGTLFLTDVLFIFYYHSIIGALYLLLLGLSFLYVYFIGIRFFFGSKRS
ncbi:MAG: hypothetical protein ACI83O_000950 [Patescibacteria group bacterium]|jgi:hypothetical protein